MKDFFFITGCYRSGTTLVEKFVNTQNSAFSLYQPFNFLFIELKKEYNNINKIETDKHLGFNYETEFDINKFTNFLSQKKITSENIENMLSLENEIIKKYSDFDLGNLAGLDVITCFKILIQEITPKTKSITTKGSKEILCQEFVPYLIENGIKVILVCRNPVDVIKSLNFGSKASIFTGGIRPTLLNLRNWREPVVIYRKNEGHPNILFIKLENFINDLETRKSILSFLNCEMSHSSLKNLVDEKNKLWSRNSSFSNNEKRSFKLSSSLIDYVEAVCFNEMNFVGYKTNIENQMRKKIITNFSEPFEITERPYYDSSYSTNKGNIDIELERL